MTTTEHATRTGEDLPAPASGTRDWVRYGAHAYDPGSGRVGIVQVLVDPYLTEKCKRVAWLRPEGGGCEWRANADKLQPAPERGAGR